MSPTVNKARPNSRMCLRALVSGFAEKRRRNRLLMMLQAFIDDSGNDGKSPVFILAGYVASFENWETFSEEWDRVLNPEDGFQMGVLKMKNAYSNRRRRSPYFGLTDQEMEDRLKSLVGVINRHAMHGVVSVIPYAIYNRLIRGKFNLLGTSTLDRPYWISFFGIMARLLQVTKHLKLDDKVDFIFDTQDNESKPLLMSEYDRFINLAPPDLRNLSGGYPIFKKDDEVLPLQAADMLAWHVRRHYFDRYAGRDPTKEPNNIFLANLFKPKHDILDLWDEDRLEQLATALNKSSWMQRSGIPMTLPDPSSIYRF